MVVLNYTGGEVNAKIVYYGPGVSGKTTNLEYIHEKTPETARGKMVSMKTQTDRTLFFDFLPLELGDIHGYRTRFLLYTVPGQVYYNATRKLVLKGVDAVVFVADSSRAKLNENLESLRNLEQNLNEHGLSLDDIPWVIQYNKRDLPDAMSVDELNARLNPLGVPSFEAVATVGTGVYDTFHGIATLLYGVLKERLDRGELETEPGQAAARPKPASASPPPPAPTAAESGGGERVDEHELDHAVDFALREADPATAVHRSAPSPAPKPAAPPKPAPAHSARAVFAPEAAATANPDDLFESIPDSPFDLELGRLPALDEASAASDEARDRGPDEFVTDPMRHRAVPKPAAKAAPARPDMPRDPRPETSRPETSRRDPRPPLEHLADTATVETPPEPVRVIRVPVRIPRSRVEDGAPIEIVLDVSIVDD